MACEITQNSILRITDEKTLELIELYEQESCLWNSDLEDYKVREKRVAAAERIARTLNIKNFEAKHVTIKFKNLRNSYCQELKKIANSINSPNTKLYIPKVFWFGKMDSFLRPYLQPSRTTGFLVSIAFILIADTKSSHVTLTAVVTYNYDHVASMLRTLINFCFLQRQFDDIDSREEGMPQYDVEIKQEVSEEPEDWQIPHHAGAETSDPPSDDDDASPTPAMLLDRLSSKRPRIEEVHSCTPPLPPLHPNPSLTLLKNISSNLENLVQQRDDPLESFGKYVATMLRNLPVEKALALQPKIISLITNAAISNSNGRISQSDEND